MNVTITESTLASPHLRSPVALALWVRLHTLLDGGCVDIGALAQAGGVTRQGAAHWLRVWTQAGMLQATPEGRGRWRVILDESRTGEQPAPLEEPQEAPERAQMPLESLSGGDPIPAPTQSDETPSRGKCGAPKYPSPDSAAKGGYPEGFEAWWQAYPSRKGSNPKKGAYGRWVRVAIDEGEEGLLQAAHAYAAHCRREGQVGTPYVMQAMTFLSPGSEAWREWVQKTLDRRSAPSHTAKEAAISAERNRLREHYASWEMTAGEKRIALLAWRAKGLLFEDLAKLRDAADYYGKVYG